VEDPPYRSQLELVSRVIEEYLFSGSITAAMKYFILPSVFPMLPYKLFPKSNNMLAFLKALSRKDPFGTFLRTQIGPGEGFRITADALRIAFAKNDGEFGEPPGFEKERGSPKDVYFTSASYKGSLIPGKEIDFRSPACYIPWNETEITCQSYSILRFDRELMELVPASGGEVPAGRRPVVGGYEDEEEKTGELYHAVGVVGKRDRVTGKAAKHLVRILPLLLTTVPLTSPSGWS
jgi:hypothetical protein